MGVSVLDVGLVFGVAKTCYPTFGKRIMKTCQYSKTPLLYTFYWSIKKGRKISRAVFSSTDQGYMGERFQERSSVLQIKDTWESHSHEL
jgi:hypothetical protein